MRRNELIIPVRRTIVQILSIFVLFIFLFPYFFMVISAFKTPIQAQAYPPAWLFIPTLQNFKVIILKNNIFHYLYNSLIVAFGNTVFSLLFALPAAWGLARFRLKGKEVVAYLFLILQMTPAVSIVFAYFFLAKNLGLYDTHILLIIIYGLWHIPWAIWMTRGFIESIPPSLEESGMVDGCSRLGAFYRITLPLAMPGIAAAAVFIFVMSWNEFTVAYFLTSEVAPTLPTTIAFFRTHLGILWGQMFATATIATFPVVLFSLFLRKYLVSALTMGAVKG